MVPASRSLTLFAAALVALPAFAAGPRQRFAVPPGSLADALALVARQAGIDIGGVDPALARIRSPGVAGRLSTAAALARLLAPTPFAARAVAPGTYRLVPRAPSARRPPPRPVAPAPPAGGGDDIVIRGSKRDVPLATYPGSATVIVPAGDEALAPHGATTQDALLRQSPILQSTELGPGRDKYFIRGIADSSFTGPTQSTAGTYFGDVRTGYNGPDPNLNLYDVERVEILEGPQGTLYGAGSIGGVIRLSPHAPELNRAAAALDLGVSATAHGGIGYDSAAMVNLAPWADRLAVRLVAYRSLDAGYIDDPGRGRSDVNRLTESGGRAAIRFRPFDGVTIDASGVIQSSHQPDLQYALREDAPLTRTSALAQPFEDDYKLGRLVIAKDWASGLRLISATGRVLHETDQRYDATRLGRFANPVAYDERNTIRLTTQEIRLSRTFADGDGWLVGFAYVDDVTGKARAFGMVASQRDLIGVTNRTRERAGFASGTWHLSNALLLTAGARYTDARMDGDPSTTARIAYIHGLSTSRIDPQAGLSYRLGPRLALFAQYQQGFRTGGLAVAPGIGRVANFRDDRVTVGEAGVRLVRSGATGLAGVAAVSYARWRNIQADLVSQTGFPYTDNVGNGRIAGLEGMLDWVPRIGLRLTGGLFLNRSRLVDPAPAYAASGERPLPDTPPVAATSSVSWTRPLGPVALQLQANFRYVGASRLGVGPVLDLPFGDYAVGAIGATVKFARLDLSLTLDNVANTRGNRFAVGNPFGIALRDEVTPLRPRTLRLGAHTGF